MSVSRSKLINYVNSLFEIEKFKDYAPNGLQVEGKQEIKVIVTGVTACQALLDRAVELNADMLLVHHGYFWCGEALQIVGMKYRRIATLLKSNINLVAYHLPLDAHPLYGNNAQIAKRFDIRVIDRVDVDGNPNMLYIGEFDAAVSPGEFSKIVEDVLKRKPLVECCGDSPIKKMAWSTGGAQDFIDIAIEKGCDAFLTGEVSERTIHTARENNIHFFSAGHHATERYGIQALGEHLADEFGLVCHFVDIDNPV